MDWFLSFTLFESHSALRIQVVWEDIDEDTSTVQGQRTYGQKFGQEWQ